MISQPPSQPPLTREANARLMRLATYIAVVVALCLVGVKFGAWLLTDSVSLLSTLVDSTLDVAASMVNLLAVRHALQPADEDHRFGHGKAENLAGLAQSAFISGSAFFLVLQAGERLYNPVDLENTSVGYIVMVIAIVATAGLVTFQKYVANRTGSQAILADSMHYTMDILVNVCVIVALFLSTELGWDLADPLFGFAIAFYILYGAYRVGRGAYDVLMDRELPDEDRARIEALALAHPLVLGVHDLRTREAGPDLFIQLHLDMDGGLILREVHEASDEVMHSIEAQFTNAQVLIHHDPQA